MSSQTVGRYLAAITLGFGYGSALRHGADVLDLILIAMGTVVLLVAARRTSHE